MTNHPNRDRHRYIKIKGGCVRLYPDGSVRYYDGEIASWRDGWGPYGTTSSLGDDERKLEEWRRRTR